ncbi:MAG: glucosyl-3-phosphoglycerate synthase [Acidimicrobiales bacterium]
MPCVRTFEKGHFGLDAVLDSKGMRRISVCLPARDEGRTIGGVIESAVLPHLGPGGSGLIDELVVVDDGSTDPTAAIARAAGARVVSRRPGGDKGRAMATAFEASVGDVVVFLDADVENATADFVPRLVGPLLVDEAVLVKAFYDRPINGLPSGGGRVTELLARPLIDLLFPALSEVRQPLAGETAAHRWVFEKVGFADGYGVEIGLLIDVAMELGVESIAQVDFGVRVHRNRPLAELRPQADDVLRTALGRAGIAPLG